MFKSTKLADRLEVREWDKRRMKDNSYISGLNYFDGWGWL